MKKELDYGVNFHQTFPPTPAYIGRILSISKGTKMSPREISDLTGIPQGESSGKVVPHLKYAAYMDLIKPDTTVPTLTDLGHIVLEEDCSCSEEITQWLMHANLCSKFGAPMWNFFIRDLLQKNREGVSKDYLSSQMQIRFGTPKFTPVITTYNELSSINYLHAEKQDDYIRIIPQHIQREFVFLYSYDLMREWDIVFPNAPEITADEVNTLGSNTCFGVSETQWFDILEMMASRGICRINKQLSPYTIVRLTTTSSLIEKLYSLLI